MALSNTAIIIVNWNGKRDTDELLTSLLACRGAKHTPIVVDNGSSDGSLSYLRAKHPHAVFIALPSNLGFSGGNNAGIRYALARDFSHIFLLNNDTCVDPGCIEALVSFCAERNIIVGAQILRYDAPERIDHLGGNWDAQRLNFTHIGVGAQAATFATTRKLDYVCGCALFAKRSVFKRVGPLWEPYFLYWEDSDFCMRAQALGIPSYSYPHARVYHKGAMGKQKNQHPYYDHRNRLFFLKRHNLLSLRASYSLMRQYLRTMKHLLFFHVQLVLQRDRAKRLEKKKKIAHAWSAVRGAASFVKRSLSTN